MNQYTDCQALTKQCEQLLQDKFPNHKMGLVVDEKARTVAVFVADCEHDAIKRILKDIKDVYPVSNMIENALMCHTYRAKAKCHPDDKFDVIKGAKIALQRLEDKYNDAKKRAIIRYQKKLIHQFNIILGENK